LHAPPLLLYSKLPLQHARWPSPPQLAAKEVAGKPRATAKKTTGANRRLVREIEDLIEVMILLQKKTVRL